MPTRLVILGATGDLTTRYLLPAIARLRETGILPAEARILGLGRDEWSVEKYRSHITERLAQYAPEVPSDVQASLVASLDYRPADVTDPAQLAEAFGSSREPLAIYLALPPVIFAGVLQALGRLSLPAESRLVIEKPFGHDLASAQALNALVRQTFDERFVFRIDHFLGMQTVQNVLGLRFANRVFEYLWNRDHITKVEINWDETVALEGRAGYYDHSGALRDMVQNHLLQLLCLVAMEAPLTFDQRDFRDKKMEVLRAVRQYRLDEVARHSVRARYTAGRQGQRELPNYVDEPGVDGRRMTETFAQVTLFIDNWRWAGVPFILRSGKAMGEDRHEIIVHFRDVPHLPFEDCSPVHNQLLLRLNPDRMDLVLNTNAAGELFRLQPVTLGTQLAPQRLSAYARLIQDILDGNAVLSIRGDEAEESWRIVEPIMTAWRQGRVPMREYPVGSVYETSPLAIPPG